jgi:hypothetical protein
VSSRRPLCLFVWKSYPHEKKIIEAFAQEGFEAVVVTNKDDFICKTQDRACFVAFVQADECPDVVELIGHMPERSRTFLWVAVSGRTSTRDSSIFLKKGAADLLGTPVHPVSFRSRARMLLIRFLKERNLPDDVILPPGVMQPGNSGPRTFIDLQPDWSGLERFSFERRAALEKTLALFTPRGKWFGVVKDPELRLSLIRFALGTKADGGLWTPGRKTRLSAQVTGYEKGLDILALDLTGERVDEDRKRRIHRESEGDGIFCTLRLGPCSLFFRAPYFWEDDQLMLELKEAIYELQRRLAVRGSWPLKGRVPAEFEAGGQQLNCILCDASATGLGVELDPALREVIKVGESCDFRFEIDGKMHAVTARLRWRRLSEEQGRSGLRAGFQLVDPSNSVRDLLGSWALECLETKAATVR